MTNSTLKALGFYLGLAAKDKLLFLEAVSKIERMPVIVRDDYVKTLLLLTSNKTTAAKALQTRLDQSSR